MNNNDLLDMWSYSDVERVGDVHFYFSLQGLDDEHEVNEPNPPIYINVEFVEPNIEQKHDEQEYDLSSYDLIDDDTSEDDISGDYMSGDDTSGHTIFNIDSEENSEDSDSEYNEWLVHGYTGEQSDVEFDETQLTLVGPSLEVNKPNVGGGGLINMLGSSETNNSGPSEPPLSELFKATKKLKKTKTNGPSEPPLENISMKTAASKNRKSRGCGNTIKVWDEPLSERVEVEPQTERARVEPQTNIGSRKKAQTKKQANKPKQKEKELKEKKNKNKDQGGEPTKPTNKRARPSDLPEEKLDVLPLVYDSDGEIVIIEEVGQTENGEQTGSGHQTKDIGVDNTDEIEDWTRWAEVHPDNLDVEEGYYSTHTLLEDDEEESTPKKNVGRKYDELKIGMVWGNVFEAKTFIRNYAIINKFEYYQVKNEDYRLKYKCGDEK
ncbi:hypothetical protein GIB67_017647 [Kingdonia uniflora]|uniref:Transposase MuDR plant domain-containing protein n=1 Tax=Kingdonia uniflora TaxID=39325 RepID=A0A7J7NAE7_9MAGN|nr:hypothetical protein GIB67_017647 [Kingdonia uniflora]